MRASRLATLLVVAVTFPVPRATADTNVVLYLHSLPPTGELQQAAEFAGAGTPSPSLDANAPQGADPKVSAATSIGNPEFRKNPLLAYWAGRINGSVANASARLWVAAAQPGTLHVGLFSGSAARTSSPFATGTIDVAAGGPTEVNVPLSGEVFGVRETLVLQTSVESESVGTIAVLYDSAAFPSSVSLDLGPYVARTPPVWTPHIGFGPVVPVTKTLAHRETSLALDPTGEQRMLVCTPSGVPNYPYGQSYFMRSLDNGASWHPLYVETSPTDTRRVALEGGDCDVAFDDAGTMYAADTWLGSLSVGASIDHGETWSGTALAATAPVVDRPWLVGGPKGTVHVTWQDVQALMPTAIWYSRSTDFARTFQPAVPVALATPEAPFSWEGNLAVAPSGTDLFLVYTRRAGPGTEGAETVWVAASHDAGATWTSSRVASMPQRSSFLYPSIALDRGGRLHVVFASPTDDAQPVWYTTSADGITWDDPVKVADGIAGYAPWVAGGDAGEAVIEWYGTLEPKPEPPLPHDFYLFWARVDHGAITWGTTTSTPVFSGVQGETPEFNQIRLDSSGRIRIGASAYFPGEEDTAWAVLYQAEQ